MRNYGTNVYSNNFEPQVNGVLDARTKIEGPASDLTLDSTWTSKDGKQWACEGLVVSVVNDPEDSKNGLYLLLDDDYSSTSNWKFIGSDVDLSSKQDVLVSGQNIKTINGNSLLGSGNLQIQVEGPSITVEPTVITLNTTGMLDRERKTLLTLDPSDTNKLVQLVSNESNYANCIITYCGVNATSESDWRERVALNYTGDIYTPSQDKENRYYFWLSFTSSVELEVYYFEIQLTIPAGEGSPTATASIITKKESGITFKQLTTERLFKYERGEIVIINPEDKETLISLFKGGYKNVSLFYAYDGTIGGGNSYSVTVNVSGLLDGAFSEGSGDDLTLTVAAEGAVHKEILTYDRTLSTWITRQDPVTCTEEIEADVKKNGYWYDRKTGFIIQWGTTDVTSDTVTTVNFSKPMITFNTTATPGVNNNSAILQINVTGQNLYIYSDVSCTVFWQAIGYAME